MSERSQKYLRLVRDRHRFLSDNFTVWIFGVKSNMGIEGEFKQVSPYLLEKFKKYPDFTDLFFDAKYLHDSEFWKDFSINPDNPADMDMFNEFTELAAETLQKLKEEKPEEFEMLKADIPQILEEGKAAYLDIDRKWSLIHVILTGYDASVRPSFLIGKNDEDGLPLINAILGGAEIQCQATYGLVRYLTAEEVQQVAYALSKFSPDKIRKRLKLIQMEEKDFNNFLKIAYNAVFNYYQNAVENGNAMFLYLS